MRTIVSAAFLLYALVLAAPLTAQSAEPKPAAEKSSEKPKAANDWSIGGTFAVATTQLQPRGSNDGALPVNGIGGEYSFFAFYRQSEHVTGNARACYGCHDLEVETAKVEIKLSEGARFSAGRFAIPFGVAGGRYDHSVYKSATKPISHIMGPMARGFEFNQGILPAPAVDNGIALRGGHMLTDMMELNYDAYLVGGMKSSGGTDLDFITSRDIGDNNAEPFIGGRAQLTRMAEFSPMSLGLSYGIGHHDPDSELLYQIGAFDARIKAGLVRFTAEFSFRETQYDDGGVKDEHLKTAAWGQAQATLGSGVTAVASYEYLNMTDIFLGIGGPTTVEAAAVTDDSNQINRFALGFAVEPAGVSGLVVKFGADYWEFSDFRDSWLFHGVIAWSF